MQYQLAPVKYGREMPTTAHPVAIVGCGYTPLSTGPTKPGAALGVDACHAAIEDAGLDVRDIDGISLHVNTGRPPTAEIVAGLGLRDLGWVADTTMGIGAAAQAAQAIDGGTATAIVVCTLMCTQSSVYAPRVDPRSGRVSTDRDGYDERAQLEVPYGLGFTVQRAGLTKRRWMHCYGITHEQIGWQCVTQRSHALLNPHAAFRVPLSLDDYLASKWIADPVRLFDCDRPVNGAYAYVMVSGRAAQDLRHPPVLLRSWVASPYSAHDFDLLPEPLNGKQEWVSPLFDDARVRPSDLDAWMLYDGFGFMAMQWMESLGLVGRGESGPYVEGGKTIGIGGPTPLNTHGGSLSEGRMHGAGHLLEAVQQLRLTADQRQVRDAQNIVVTVGFPNTGEAAILGR